MKKLKITPEQYAKINSLVNESKAVKGGINRVNKAAKAEFRSLEEDLSNVVTAPLPGISNTKMKPAKEVPQPKVVNEDISSPELHQAIHHFIENIWLNPSQKGLDKFFVEHGITWGDIMSYLTATGIIAAVGKGLYKVKNFFKRKFSKDQSQAMKEKMEEISKITKKIEADPEAPWSQNKLKDPAGQQLAAPEMEENHYVDEVSPEIGEASNYYNAEPHPDSPEANRIPKEPPVQSSNSPRVYTPIAMGHEIALLNGPDGKYAFYFDDIPRDEFQNPQYQLDIDDIADYVNDNIKTLPRGNGLKDFEKTNLVKIDEPLKAELMALYAKDSKLMHGLQNLAETTGAASSGAFTAPLALGPIKKDIDELKVVKLDEKPIEETNKLQYPGGEMVDFDSCVKYNNNKSAENGGCSQGAVDHVVKTHKGNSKVSKDVYEQIAKKTGRSAEDIEKLIESKLYKSKSL